MMAVYVFGRTDTTRDGPQPFDPGRHMRQVAELVGQVFADELDARGRSALRDMAFAGRLSPYLGGVISQALFSDYVSGYVWMENGRVIGNVSLQPIDQGGLRWRISNVAVALEHRNRGIAKALVAETLHEVARHGGGWTLLQVRGDNPIAHKLYLGLGFTDVCREGVWRLPMQPDPLPPLDPAVPLEPLRTLTGADWWELARAARTPLAQWAEPLDASRYRLGPAKVAGEWLARRTGLYCVERWAAWQGQRLMGVVESVANLVGGADTLRFAVLPEARGTLEHSLVVRGLHSLAGTSWRPVIVEHSGDHSEGVTALEAAGFRLQRDLVTMRRAMTPADKR